MRLGGVVVAVGIGACAGPAQAGLYHVYSCRTPAGVAAPTDGWRRDDSGVGVDRKSDACVRAAR